MDINNLNELKGAYNGVCIGGLLDGDAVSHYSGYLAIAKRLADIDPEYNTMNASMQRSVASIMGHNQIQKYTHLRRVCDDKNAPDFWLHESLLGASLESTIHKTLTHLKPKEESAEAKHPNLVKYITEIRKPRENHDVVV